jgi:hypothetical protein
LRDAFCIGRSGGTDERLHLGRSFVGEREDCGGSRRKERTMTRKYQSTDGKTAILTKHDESRGFYHGSHVIAECGSTWRCCADFAEAVEWLTRAFNCGWTRVRS